MTFDEAQVNYLRWLSGAAPTVYRRAIAKNRPKNATLGDLGWIQAVVQAVAAVGSAVIAKKSQDKAIKAQKKAQDKADADALKAEQELANTLVQVNTQRAQRGLPPVDRNGQVIPGSQLPMPQGLSQLTTTNVGGIPTLYLLLGGAGLLGVVMLARR